MIKLKCRWSSENSQLFKELGIEEDENNYTFKEIYVNMNHVKFIDEYDGVCCLNFSAVTDDTLITNIPWEDVEKLNNLINK